MTKDYPVAFRQRLEKIVENNEELSKRWKMKLPEWMEYELDDYEEE